MEQRKLRKRLRAYGAACRAVVPEKKEQDIQALLRLSAMREGQDNAASARVTRSDGATVRRTRGTLWDFIWEQIGYLGRYCLIWQAVWIAVFGYMLQYGAAHLGEKENGNGILVMLSVLPPLLALLTVEEVTKIYQRSMLEIEYATKYSLRSAVMVRMAALCIMHTVILTTCILCLHTRIEVAMGRLLVYGFTPMILVTAVLFQLMQFCQGQQLRHAAAGVYVLMTVLVIVGNTERLGFYQPVYFKVWCAVCAVGIALGVRQLIHLNGKLVSYEQIAR